MLDTLTYKIICPHSHDEYERYFRFRWEQLRKPLKLPLGSERDSLDSQSFHCAAIHKQNSIIGVGSIQPAENQAMRIRYMAVIEKYQRMRIGSRIILKLLEYAQENGAATCWLNARANALEFYRQHGFEVIATMDTGLGIPHFRMQLKLETSTSAYK